MILYRTKLFGLLSDRVFKAIQESGKITGKKLDRLEARQLMREVDKKSETSFRTIENLWKEGEINKDRLDKKINSLNSRQYELGKDADTADKELLDYVRKHDHKIDRTDPEFIELNNKAKELGDKLLNNKEYKELESQISDLERKRDAARDYFNNKMDLQSERDLERFKRYNDYQYRVQDRKEIKKPSTSEINSSWNDYIDGLNESERPNAFTDSINDRIGEYYKKYKGRTTPRKTKNSDKIFKDIENDYNKRTGKHFVMDSPGNNFYSPNSGEVHLGSTDPATAIHEVRHRDRAEDLKIGLSNRPKEFHYPKGVQDRLEYVREEEGDAFKTSFRKMFLNKHSGGRDWRSAHVNGLKSLGTYYAPFGQDINKTGFVDLSYNVPKELMEKIRENAKKKGIDLNRSQKINYKPATEDEASEIRKYVYRKGRSNYQ